MTNAAPGKGRTALSLDSVIVTRNISVNQLFLLIDFCRLTEIIELFESIGITGDLAIFMLASLQNLEVGA